MSSELTITQNGALFFAQHRVSKGMELVRQLRTAARNHRPAIRTLGTVLNDIFAHQNMLPTLMAAVGVPNRRNFQLQTNRKNKTMKLINALVTISVAAILTLGTVLAGGSAIKEMLLGQSGFRLTTITTQRQREQINSLPEGQVSAIMYQHKLFYVFPTMKKDVVYVGKQQQFDAYKQALSQEYQKEPAARPNITEETAGPNHVQIQEFDGFGPMNSFGDE